MAKNFFIPLIIFFAAFLFYFNFPSNQYAAVDGNLRCLSCMGAAGLQLHGNNHMLYPVNVVLWSRLVSALFFIKPQDPFAFIRMVEYMNSFFAAIAISVFFLVLKKATSSLKISILGACALAGSNSFMVNAVNSSEPMAGFTTSAISVIFTCAWLTSNRIFLGFAGALLLSLSAAIYQSMFLIAPSLAVLVYLYSIENGKNIAVKKVFQYIFFISISYLAIYLLSHWLIAQDRSIADIIKKMCAFNTFEIWGRISLAKFIAAPFAVINGVIYLDNMRDGIRAFFSEQPLNYTVLTAVMLYAAAILFFILLAYILFKVFKKAERKKRIYLTVSIVGFIFTISAPIYWSLTYTKLLMQPTAFLIVITALAVSEAHRLPLKQVATIFRSFLLITLTLMFFWNTKNVLLKMHLQPANLKDAKELTELLGEESLIVLDWDSEMASLYSEFYKKPGQHIFCISQEMIRLKRNKALFSKELKTKIASFKNSGRRVWFLGVLEKSRSAWSYFLEERLGIAYELFDEYRKSSRLVRRFGKTDLYEY